MQALYLARVAVSIKYNICEVHHVVLVFDSHPKILTTAATVFKHL